MLHLRGFDEALNIGKVSAITPFFTRSFAQCIAYFMVNLFGFSIVTSG